jgi:hypothetical protein
VVAKAVEDVDLCSSRPEAGAGQHQAGTRFLRRLRTDVGEPDHFAQLHYPARPAMAVDQRVDVGQFERRCLQ